MAIADMTRFRLYGLDTERDKMLGQLMRSRVVEISDAHAVQDADPENQGTGAPSDMTGIRRLEDGKGVQEYESLAAATGTALQILGRYSPVKKGMFSIRREMNASQLEAILSERNGILDTVREIQRLEDALVDLKSEESRIHGRIAFLKPWLGIGMDLSLEQTRLTVLQAGTLPVKQEAGALEELLQSVEPASLVSCHSTEGETRYCVAIWHASSSGEVLRVLKDANWNRISFREVPGDPDTVSGKLQERLEEIVKEKKQLESSIRAHSDARERMEFLHDAMNMERDKRVSLANLAVTGKAFLITGWVPSDSMEALRKRVERDFTCFMEFEAPSETEEVPVLVRSNRFTEAIRPVMEMYGTPSYREIDPNFLTLPFFAIFFGLIMSDAGYGLILAGSAGFVLWRFKLEPVTRMFAKLVVFCGFTSIFWGLLFGGFFGIAAFSQHALWFSPGEEGGTEKLMVWCLLFGVIHLFTGMGLKAANLLRRKQYVDALCDVGFPYVMFTGFAMTVLPNVPGLDPASTAPVSAIGLYVLIVGIALVVFTSGRKSKSIFGKLFGGLPRLYDIIGFLGDVLSYMRLLALSLAGGILGGLINDMASGFGSLVAKLIGGVLLILLGHGINFAMSILGAFVHSCRLQYLEFFTKFLEGGGRPFRQYGPVTKYIIMKQED